MYESGDHSDDGEPQSEKSGEKGVGAPSDVGGEAARGAVAEKAVHDQAKVETGDVNRVALSIVLNAAKRCSSKAASGEGVREAAFQKLGSPTAVAQAAARLHALAIGVQP